MQDPTFKPIADHALLIEFATQISQQANDDVVLLDAEIQQNPPDGLLETTPALVNILIDFDPLLTDHQSIEAHVRTLLPIKHDTQKQGRTHQIDICYDLDLAPDIEAVAKASNVSVTDVINIHSSATFRVGMYGFAPGYAYLTGVPQEIQVPRKTTAARDIPKGSVMIAGSQCLTTTLVMPTGWSIIGRTHTEILQTNAQNPFLFDVGDTVTFHQIDRTTYEDSSQEFSI
jgi:KipI family sensor histidine kinase inhibitor